MQDFLVTLVELRIRQQHRLGWGTTGGSVAQKWELGQISAVEELHRNIDDHYLSLELAQAVGGARGPQVHGQALGRMQLCVLKVSCNLEMRASRRQ